MNYSANTSRICAYGSNVTWSCTLSREYNTRTLDYGNREQTYAVRKFVVTRHDKNHQTYRSWCSVFINHSNNYTHNVVFGSGKH
jgi:hypothetical protein